MQEIYSIARVHRGFCGVAQHIVAKQEIIDQVILKSSFNERNKEKDN